jgi:hypothetical protein
VLQQDRPFCYTRAHPRTFPMPKPRRILLKYFRAIPGAMHTLFMLCVLQFIYVAPVVAQNDLQKEQARVMRESLPPEAQCSYNEDGRPICTIQFGPPSSFSMLRVKGYSPKNFLVELNASFLVSDARDENVRSIVIKYLNTFGIDGSACINAAMNDARHKVRGAQGEGIAQVANNKYQVECRYSEDPKEIGYFAFVSANKSF